MDEPVDLHTHGHYTNAHTPNARMHVMQALTEVQCTQTLQREHSADIVPPRRLKPQTLQNHDLK